MERPQRHLSTDGDSEAQTKNLIRSPMRSVECTPQSNAADEGPHRGREDSHLISPRQRRATRGDVGNVAARK